MLIHEKIQEDVLKLPVPLWAEVLDFVEYLIAKAGHEALVEENQEWSEFSLACAMRGMEDEETSHTLLDLKTDYVEISRRIYKRQSIDETFERAKRYLEEKSLVEENQEWSEFSLACAMRGMEDEESLYTLADLKDIVL